MPPTINGPGRWRLAWRPSERPLDVLSDGISRSFIETSSGKLELLSAVPPNPTQIPLVFLHGGFGCAAEYSKFLLHFSALSHPAYTISLRGHGHSWCPSFLRMVFLTTAYTLATDVAAGIAHVRGIHLQAPVLVAHSNGGGLAQIVLDKGLQQTAGLILLSGTPNFGALSVYKSWFRLDPWFLPRLYIRDFGHPRSPLSSTDLVHRAFFSARCPTEIVLRCERWMSEYESLIWPMNIMGRFVDVKRVLKNCEQNVLVVGADEDTLMIAEDMKQMVAEYRRAVSGDNDGHVGLEVIQGSGHNIHNDLKWQLAAELLSNWLNELD